MSLLFGLPLIIYARLRVNKKRITIGLAVSDSWLDRFQILRLPYDLAIARAGANILTFSPKHDDKLDVRLGEIHGLVLSGGEDIHPRHYNGDLKANQWINSRRDELELKLIKKAIERNFPMLCICRGAQLLAVSQGGTLERHGLDNHISVWGRLARHAVSIKETSKLFNILGNKPVHQVNSFHHQAITSAGALEVAAIGDEKIIEAVELSGSQFIVGIQWHPELQAVLSRREQRLFEVLIKAGKRGQ